MKKAAKKVKPTPKKLTMLDRLPKNDGERLELMIRMAEKHTSQLMIEQAARLRLQLKEWQKANKK